MQLHFSMERNCGPRNLFSIRQALAVPPIALPTHSLGLVALPSFGRRPRSHLVASIGREEPVI